jgi:hypothetical protein
MNFRSVMIVGALFLTLVVSVSIGSAPSKPAASPAPDAPRRAPPARAHDDALLREVRLIRESLQEVRGHAQREQILVERIRTHDQRVERLDRQLTELRDEMGGIEIHVRQTEEREKSLALLLERSADQAQRQAHEIERREMRFMQESQKQRLDRMRDRESTLVAALQREERALRSLEGRLEVLDRQRDSLAQ